MYARIRSALANSMARVTNVLFELSVKYARRPKLPKNPLTMTLYRNNLLLNNRRKMKLVEVMTRRVEAFGKSIDNPLAVKIDEMESGSAKAKHSNRIE
jgi:hypothetical protein